MRGEGNRWEQAHFVISDFEEEEKVCSHSSRKPTAATVLQLRIKDIKRCSQVIHPFTPQTEHKCRHGAKPCESHTIVRLSVRQYKATL